MAFQPDEKERCLQQARGGFCHARALLTLLPRSPFQSEACEALDRYLLPSISGLLRWVELLGRTRPKGERTVIR